MDKCARLKLAYASVAYFDRILHTGPRSLELSFGDAPQLGTTLDLDALRRAHGDETIDELTDQFITRRLSADSASLSTELIIRLCNGAVHDRDPTLPDRDPTAHHTTVQRRRL